MSDWEEGSSSPEAGQQVFHEAITPVQSSPSSSERDENDSNVSASQDVMSEAGLESEDSSSGEDVTNAMESATRQVNDLTHSESEGEEQTRESVFEYKNKSSNGVRSENGVEDEDSCEGQAASQEGTLVEEEEEDEDSRQVLSYI